VDTDGRALLDAPDDPAYESVIAVARSEMGTNEIAQAFLSWR